MNCPHCGAPANPPPGVPTYECSYCKRTFNTLPAAPTPPPSALPPGYPGAPPPYGAPPPAYGAPPPQIVVIAPGGSSTPLRVRTGGGGAGWMIPFFAVFVIALVVGALRFWWTGSLDGLHGGWSWDGKEPLECTGNDDLEVKGVNATLSGTAIIASGNCHVKIVDSNIKADTIVEAAGNAQVTFQNGSVDGKVATDASGNARVRFNGTKVTGEKRHSGNAKVD
jgi:hypothetical protein